MIRRARPTPSDACPVPTSTYPTYFASA